MPPRINSTDLGFAPKRVRLVLLPAEWRLLEDEADRTHRAVGTTISIILGLSIANRETVNSLTQQARDDSAARAPQGVGVR